VADEPADPKDRYRTAVWDALDRSGEARFPFPPHGRIPNFAGADAAAARLAETATWDEAAVVKANPDAPQLPVRRAALRAGKQVFVAVPRLRDERCFLHLDPAAIDDVDGATTVSGIGDAGDPVHPDQVPHVDCILSGSVAVSTAGDRIGKGEGFSDLEFGLLAESGRVDSSTAVVTTVHPFQVFDRPLPTTPTDVPIDLIATPDRVHRPARADRPDGIEWSQLDAERIAEMPALARRRSGGDSA
jgi:5-formyltetrahydrofolate cyclo-ligase